MTDILDDICKTIVSMDPERIAAIEVRIAEARSSLERISDPGAAANAVRQMEQAKRLLSHAEDLFGGWVHLFSSSACGYTAEGTANMCPHGRIAMKG